jgi:D-aminopeptidase
MRDLLRINGIPIGKHFPIEMIPSPKRPKDGSIIIIVATDAPLLPNQCKRLAQRATLGLARVGGTGHETSGDIFLAFSTANNLPDDPSQLRDLKMLPFPHMSPLFDATAEATEEAILNAMTSAETMTGYRGTVYALPTDKLADLMRKS